MGVGPAFYYSNLNVSRREKSTLYFEDVKNLDKIKSEVFTTIEKVRKRLQATQGFVPDRIFVQEFENLKDEMTSRFEEITKLHTKPNHSRLYKILGW